MAKLKTRKQLSEEDVRKLFQEYWETIESLKDSKGGGFAPKEEFGLPKRNGGHYGD